MKTALEKGMKEFWELGWGSDNIIQGNKQAILIALQDFGEKIRSKLRNQEDIMILEDIMLKEGLK